MVIGVISGSGAADAILLIPYVQNAQSSATLVFSMCFSAMWGLDLVDDPRVLFLYVSRMFSISLRSVLVASAVAQFWRNTCFETLRCLSASLASLRRLSQTDVPKHLGNLACDPRGLRSDKAFFHRQINAWMHWGFVVASSAAPRKTKFWKIK